MKPKKEFNNDYAIGHTNPVLNQHARINKKANVAYWDEMESKVEEAFKAVAICGGVYIEDLLEMVDVKELTEEMMKRIKEQFPEADWPYIDQSF